MARFSVYRTLAACEHYIGGYRVEHLQIGLQMGVAATIALLPLVINALYQMSVTKFQADTETVWYSQSQGSATWCIIVVVFTLEPAMGSLLRKSLLRLLGVALASGLGIAILELARAAGHGYDYSTSSLAIAHVVVILTAVTLALLALHRLRRWLTYSARSLQWSVMLLTLCIVVVPSIRSTVGVQLDIVGRRVAAIAFGVVISVAVSFLVFPIRARTLLEKRMASTLVKLGDLGVWMLGQVCAEPGKDGGLPGASHSDEDMDYKDDGLSAALRPLRLTLEELGDDVAAMRGLLASARAEWYWLRKPRLFPAERYSLLIKSCYTVLGLWGSLLYTLESGRFSLACCHEHVGELAELGVLFSSSYAALSTLVRKPKKAKVDKMKRKSARAAKHGWGFGAGRPLAAGSWRWLRERTRRTMAPPEAPAAAAADDSGVAAALPPAAAAAADGLAAQATAAGGREGDLESQASSQDHDDPFAELAVAAQHSPDRQADLVTLSSEEVESVHTLARQLSQRAMQRAYSRQQQLRLDSRLDEEDCEGLQQQQHDSAWGAAAEAAAAEAAEAAAAPGDAAVSALAAALGSSGSVEYASDEERVLAKLKQLCDAQLRLWDALRQERRARPSSSDVEEFAVLCTTALGVARQTCSCFTALAPKHAPLLHAYSQRLSGPRHARML